MLNLYTKDYVGIQDGETETRGSIEKWLSDYDSELNKGSSLLLYQRRVEPASSGTGPPLAWATYDYVFQAIRKGEPEAQDSGQCTTLLRKEGSTGSFSMNTVLRRDQQDETIAVGQKFPVSIFSQHSGNASHSSISIGHRPLPLIPKPFLYA